VERGMRMSKKVVITGANKGLGLALTRLYLEKGCEVYSGIRNNPSEALSSLKQEYKEKLNIINMDVSKDESVNKAAEEIRSLTDSIDILINNAAILYDEYSQLPLEEANTEIALETFNVNTLGALRVNKALLALVKAGKNKVIANISSEAGSIGENWRDNMYDYCMSKAALNMQSAILQKYVEPYGVKVLALHPGWMITDMGGSDAAIKPEVAAQGIAKLIEEYEGKLDDIMYMDYTGKPYQW
jgi:NAD(P)-dependent dehydrogenase (short-subunit alcohol dehydrogenase family)